MTRSKVHVRYRTLHDNTENHESDPVANTLANSYPYDTASLELPFTFLKLTESWQATLYPPILRSGTQSSPIPEAHWLAPSFGINLCAISALAYIPTFRVLA